MATHQTLILTEQVWSGYLRGIGSLEKGGKLTRLGMSDELSRANAVAKVIRTQPNPETLTSQYASLLPSAVCLGAFCCSIPAPVAICRSLNEKILVDWLINSF